MKQKLLFTSFIALIVFSLHGQQDSLAMSKLGHLPYLNDLADIWGYADNNGREFALVGVQNGFSIVEVTNPVNPVEKQFVAGPLSTWRDIKTWSHYAYVVHDYYYGGLSSDGIMIVDLNTIDSTNLSVTYYYPQVAIQGVNTTFDRAHNIYIDETGTLYAFGSNIGNGGALMIDVATDPENPTVSGRVSNNYYHDGMARGDTLYGAAITAGQFEVVDVSDKSNPSVLATQNTPFNFCHNVWISDNSNVIFTTDEKSGAPIAAYDISNLNNITLLDTIRTSLSPENDVIPHNTHVLGDFLVTSYYTSGVQIVDASQPNILVETAYYDTSPSSGDGFNGAWGSYPYLPSGNQLVSDIETGLWVLDSEFPRAAFLTVLVKDSVSGNSLVNASLDLLNSDIAGSSNIFGNFRAGQKDTGTYQLVVSKTGYETDTTSVKLEGGVVKNLSVALVPVGFSIDEFNSYGIEIYPLPVTNGEFTVQISEELGNSIGMKIYGMEGQLLQHISHLETGENKIKSDLPPGNYLIMLERDSRVVSQRKLLISN